MLRSFVACALIALPGASWALRPPPPPMGCGTVTMDGECNGTLLQYCDTTVQPNQLIVVDCTVQVGNGASCEIDAGGRAQCVSGGGPCLQIDPNGMLSQVSCVGNTPGCLEDQVGSACTDPLPACGPNDVGSCQADRLIKGCLGTQPWLLDCPAFGATCSAGQCVGAALGEPCNSNVACAAPYVCGRLSRCAEPPDAGVSSPDAAPRADGGVPIAPDAASPAADAAELDAAMPALDGALPRGDALISPDATPLADAASSSFADASVVDSGGLPTTASEGCTCSSADGASSPLIALGMLALVAYRRRTRASLT